MAGDLPFKPDWCDTVKRVTLQLMPAAYDEGTAVLHFLVDYRKSDELGGSSLSAVLLRLSAFKEALGIERLPEDIETHGYQYLVF